jgi:hypothetical protein
MRGNLDPIDIRRQHPRIGIGGVYVPLEIASGLGARAGRELTIVVNADLVEIEIIGVNEDDVRPRRFDGQCVGSSCQYQQTHSKRNAQSDFSCFQSL